MLPCTRVLKEPCAASTGSAGVTGLGGRGQLWALPPTAKSLLPALSQGQAAWAHCLSACCPVTPCRQDQKVLVIAPCGPSEVNPALHGRCVASRPVSRFATASSQRLAATAHAGVLGRKRYVQMCTLDSLEKPIRSGFKFTQNHTCSGLQMFPASPMGEKP